MQVSNTHYERIGTTKRKFIGSNLDIPSVGKYVIDLPQKIKGVTMGVKFKPSSVFETPGCIQYNKTRPDAYKLINEPLQTQGINIGYKQSLPWAKLGGPGPADYDGKYKQKQTRRFNFGAGDKDSIYKAMPQNNPSQFSYRKRPNQYYPRPQTVSPTSAVIGNSTRDAYYLRDPVPGPSQYFTQPSESPKTRQGISFAGKYRYKTSNGNPGPGTYEQIKFTTERCCRMGVSNKTDFVDPDAKNKPGPGAYNIQEAFLKNHTPSRGSTFNRDRRRTFETISSIPGPGAYIEKYSSLGGPRAKMIFVHKTDGKFYTVNDYPGPGTYNPTQTTTITQEDQSGMTKSDRPTQVRNRFYSVGPGTYNIQLSPKSQRGKRPDPSDVIVVRSQPGPGYYNIGGMVGDIPQYMKKKPQTATSTSNQTKFTQSTQHS